MNKYKILLETMPASDSKAIKEMQKKLNQWITTGKLKKYEMKACGDLLAFNILLYK